MDRFKKVYVAKCAVILSAIPALIWAHSSGPDPNVNGAPPSNRSCNQTACHVGTAVNDGGGKVEVTFSDGCTYTPGQGQHLTVKVSDPAARAYGFQMSSQLASNNAQAGTFTITGPNMLVLCVDGSVRPNSGCRSNPATEYVEHSLPSTTGVFNVDWTPPANAAGDVKFYVAGNGANGNGSETGDHIYAAVYTLTAATPGGGKPTISVGGIVNAGSGKAEIASGTWVSIFGSNLAQSRRVLDGPDLINRALPVCLGGVSINVGTKRAFIGFIGQDQINVQVPDDTAVGDTAVQVTNANGQSAPITTTRAALSPAFLPFTDSAGKKYIAARHADFSVMAKPGLFAGLTTVPAKPGEVVLLFAVGLGPTNPAVAAGQVPANIARTTNPVTIRFGEVAVTPDYAGVSPGSAGLYQFNVKVPDTIPNGDVPVVAEINGLRSQDNIFITVQR